MAISVFTAQSAAHIEAARRLFREYAASLDFDLDFQDFDRELAGMPGEYAPPGGCLLLAGCGHEAQGCGHEILGCGAVRPWRGDICEMKRLYVRPAWRGRGIAAALARALIQTARASGYRAMRLDTVPSMAPARRLYDTLGFRQIAPYRYNPIPGTIYMELVLDDDV